MARQRILVVDDAEVFREIMFEILSRRGYEVLLARDGLEALEQAQQPLDLMLLDLLLPKMTGFDVLRELRSNPETKHLPILAVSGIFQEESHMGLLQSLGANGFVSKSLTPTEIADQAVKVLSEIESFRKGEIKGLGESSQEFLWRKPFAETVTAISRMNLFKELTEEQRQKVLTISRRVKFFRDQVILREGEPGDRFYGIISGRVRVEKRGQMEKFTVIARLGPGEEFGELALVDREHRSATCKAETEVEALEITRMDFELAFQEDPELERKCLRALVKVLAQRLRETDARLTYSRALIEKIAEP